MSTSTESESEQETDGVIPQAPPLPAFIQEELMQRLQLNESSDYTSTSTTSIGLNTSRPTFEPVLLHFAINKEDLEAVRDQVERGVDLNFVIHGNPPLFLACLRRQFDIANMLISAGANVTMGEVYAWHRQPIHLAAMWGENVLLTALLNHGASIQAADGMLMTPLHWAASYGALETVRLLVDMGAHLESKDDRGKTPLHRATACNHVNIVRVLRESGASVNAQDVFGWTPLHQAVFCSLPIIDSLLELGANPNIRDNLSFTPIHLMLLRHDYDHLRMMAKSDLQYYTRDRKITTSCTDGISEFLDDPEILNLLLDYGMDVNALSTQGTAMELAIKIEQAPMVKWLIQAGANIPCVGPAVPGQDNTIINLLLKHKQLIMLKEQCKRTIRRFIYAPLSDNIDRLPLPVPLKQWLQIDIQRTHPL